jgi:adenylosuccinate lyase
MDAVRRGGDRQHLHERLRVHSLAAQEAVARGGDNPLLDAIAGDSEFRMEREEIEAQVDPQAFTGRSADQVDEYLSEVVEPLLARHEAAGIEEPRV